MVPRSTSVRISIASRESSDTGAGADRRSRAPPEGAAAVSRSTVSASRSVRTSLIEAYDALRQVFTVYCNLAYVAGPSYFKELPECVEWRGATMGTGGERGRAPGDEGG